MAGEFNQKNSIGATEGGLLGIVNDMSIYGDGNPNVQIKSGQSCAC